MELRQINRSVILAIAGNIILVFVLMFVADWCLSTTINNVRTGHLKRQAETGMADQKAKSLRLTKELEMARSDIDDMKALHYPSLADLKDMTREHHLSISKVEKSARSMQDKKETHRYNATFIGSMSGLVKFVHEVQNRYLFEAEQILLQSADESGETVSLSISMYISEA